MPERDVEWTLWVTDKEMIQRLGVPEKSARVAIQMLDRTDPSFPKKEPLWCDRRYWPALRRWFDERYGGVAPTSGAASSVPRHRPRPRLEAAIARLANRKPAPGS